jgi:hypothetical protein
MTVDQRTAMELMKSDSPQNVAWMVAAREDPQCPWEIRAKLAIHMDCRIHGQPAASVGVSHLTPKVVVVRRESAS